MTADDAQSSRADAGVVTSIKDERVAEVRTLRTRTQRVSAGRCVIEGRLLIEQAASSGARLQTVLRATGAAGQADDSLASRLEDSGVSVILVRDSVLRQVVGAPKPVSWCAVAVLPEEVGAGEPWSEFVVVCDGVADQGNLGTIARSARALGVVDLVLTDPGTDLSSRRVLESSRGAVFGVRARRFESPELAMQALRAAGFQIVATGSGGDTLQGLAQLDDRPVALVLGGETTGISAVVAETADMVVAIPMRAAVDSLNVGVSAGISIYELRTKMILGALTPRIRNTVGRNVTLAAQLIRSALDRLMRQAAGLSASQAIALMVVTAEQRTSEQDLRRDLGLAPDELTRSLSPLIERGWLSHSRDAYQITSLGEQMLASLWPLQEQLEERLLAGFSGTEREALRASLERLCANASSLLSAAPRPHQTWS